MYHCYIYELAEKNPLFFLKQQYVFDFLGVKKTNTHKTKKFRIIFLVIRVKF